MRSRFGRVVILGPPLLALLAAGPILRTIPQVVAGRLPVPEPPAACVPSDAANTATTGDAVGTWWSRRPELTRSGVLTGWILTVGSPQARTVTMSLAPESIVTGPDGGRVVATTDDGERSTVRIIEGPGFCSRSIAVDGAVARRAILTPSSDGVIAHLLDRPTRSDLGIWNLPLDGTDRTPLLPPVPDALLRAAGIDRVWATDLRLSPEGRHLAIQSCAPDACVTRVLHLDDRSTTVIDGEHGALIGFIGDRLVTRAGCSGLPCAILAFDLATGRSETIEASAIGASVSRDGQLVVAIPDDDGSATAVAIDLQTRERRSLGLLEPGVVLDGTSGTAGIETPADAVGLIQAGGQPATLVIAPPATSDRKVQP
ncbi:MAG: hypothetical protein V4515_06595 [Chloroflexota bacterium]